MNVNIQEFIDKSKTAMPLAELSAVASDRAAFGDDVVSAFKAQIELRSLASQQVLDTAEKAGRESLLASEQRSFDSATRERDQILSLLRHVEQRTDQKTHVPATQTTTTIENRDLSSPVLGREQRASDWLKARGNYAYANERGSIRLGALVRAMGTDNRQGLSPLELRALSEGTGSAGGFTVPEIVGAQFIDRVRERLIVAKSGAQFVPMTSDVLHLARIKQPGIADGSPLTNSAVGAWKTENQPITAGDMELERVTFNAKTLPLLIYMSVELQEDSTNIDAIIEAEMARSISEELDRVALVGSGSGQEPRGISNTSGVLEANGAISGSPAVADWDFLIDAIGQLWAEGIDPNLFVSSPAFAVLAAKFKDESGQPLRLPSVLEKVAQARSRNIGDVAILGDFAQLMVGLRTSFKLEVSRTAGDAFGNMQVAVRAYLRGDVQLAHPEAFVVLD